MSITHVGVDIAKSVFHVHGVDRHDQVQWRGKYTRGKWLDAIVKRVPTGAEIGMEACASAHHWARALQARGYRVKLVAVQFVTPYVKSNKNDRVDAAAICEAMGRPHMRFVADKTVAQQDVQAAHRIRSELVQQRTAKANQIRGLIGEYGLVAPTVIGQLRAALPRWLEDAENGLTDDFRVLLAGLAEDQPREIDEFKLSEAIIECVVAYLGVTLMDRWAEKRYLDVGIVIGLHAAGVVRGNAAR